MLFFNIFINLLINRFGNVMGCGFKFFFGLIVIALVLVLGALYFESYLTEKDLEVEIVNTVVVTNAGGERKELILTRGETFVNEDNSLLNKSNSKELQLKLLPGRRLKIRVVGYKLGFNLPFHSEFRNIIKIVGKKKGIF